MDDYEATPGYGILVINHAYNEGKITFKEWLALSRAWAEKMLEQHREGTTCPPPLPPKPSEAEVTPD